MNITPLDVTDERDDRDRRLSHPDDFFSELDQQRVWAAGDSWTIEVYGVHVEADQAWIQVASPDDGVSTILVRLPMSCTSDEALDTLEAWLRQPAENRSRVIDRMRAA